MLFDARDAITRSFHEVGKKRAKAGEASPASAKA